LSGGGAWRQAALPPRLQLSRCPRGARSGRRRSVLSIPEKVLFVVLAGGSFYLAYLGFARLVRIVERGQVGALPRTNGLLRRSFDGVVKTLSQRTVFRARPVASFFHSFIFYGFVFYLAVNVIDGLNGFLPPSFTSRLNFGFVGDAYRLFADVLTVLILVGMVFFLVRRFLAQPRELKHNARTL